MKEFKTFTSFSVNNLDVDNIKTVVDELTQKGVSIKQIEDANESSLD